MLDNTVLAYVFGFGAGVVGLMLARDLRGRLTVPWILVVGVVVSILFALVYALPGLGSSVNPVTLWLKSTLGVGLVTLLAIILRDRGRTTERPSQYRGKGENNGV